MPATNVVLFVYVRAHEVAHTVQQRGGNAPSGKPQTKLAVSQFGSATVTTSRR
jgi:predicted metalloprotease